jgi:hypothetical protein
VFDDSSSPDDPGAGLLGLAEVPFAALNQNLPVEGGFQLVDPSTGAAAGKVWLTAAWTNPLAPKQHHQLPAMQPAQLQQQQQQQQVEVVMYDPDKCMPPSKAAAGIGRQLLSRMEQQQGEPHVPLSPSLNTAPITSNTEAQGHQHQHHNQQQQQQQRVLFQEPPAGNAAAVGSTGQMSYAKQQLQARWDRAQASKQAHLPPPHEVVPVPGGLTAIKTNTPANVTSAAQGGGPQQRMLLFNSSNPVTTAAAAARGGLGAGLKRLAVSGRVVPSVSSNNSSSGSGAVAALGSNFNSSSAARQRYQQVEQSLDCAPASAAAAAAEGACGNVTGRQGQSPPPLPLWHASRAAAAGFAGGASLTPADGNSSATKTAGTAAAAAAAYGSGSGAAGAAVCGEVLKDGVVLQQVPSAAEAWGDYDSKIYFRVDGLHLSGDVLADEGVQCMLVAHSFMEDWTEVGQQCTRAVAKR